MKTLRRFILGTAGGLLAAIVAALAISTLRGTPFPVDKIVVIAIGLTVGLTFEHFRQKRKASHG